MFFFHGYESWATIHELVQESSFKRWFSIGYLHFHMLFSFLLSLEDGFILGIFLGLGMVIPWFRNGLWVWSSCERLTSMISYMVWFGCCCGLLFRVLWRIILALFTSRGVCRRTWYRLWFAWFLFGLGYLIRCSISLTLYLRLVWYYDHQFVFIYVMWEMTWLFLYLFPLLVVESLGDCWRFLMRVVHAGYWFMYCGCR